jgi:hypothetical protein
MTAPELIITGLENGQNYNIDVFSISPSGIGRRGENYIQIIPTATGTNNHTTAAYSLSVPSAPSNLSSTSENNSGSISWDAVADDSILGYLVWYYDTTYHLFTVVNKDTTRVNISSLANGTTYRFAVASYNLNGISTMSSQVSITPQSNNVPCLVSGTQVLTSSGYKPIELLNRDEDLIVTADGRRVPFHLLKYVVEKTTEQNAPYCIKAHAFGRNIPTEDMILSPLHAFRISNKMGLWQIPMIAAKMNKTGIVQEKLGRRCEYYHILLPNYFTDNLVIGGGNVVESFCGKRANYNLDGPYAIYKYNKKLGGFTRTNPVGLSSASQKK